MFFRRKKAECVFIGLKREGLRCCSFICVLSETLIVQVGEDQDTLEARDSIYFESTVPPAYRKACCALVVTAG